MSVPSIDPTEFCQKWLHRYKDIHPHERGFTSECCVIISALTGYSSKTVYGWLSGISNPPEPVRRQLGLIDVMFDETSDIEAIRDLLRRIASNTR